MDELLSTIAAATAAFAATNVDDLVLVAAFFALAGGDRPLRDGDVVAGQVAGLVTLVALSVAGALGALLLPDAAVGLLGLIPLGLGTWGLAHRADEEADVLPTGAGWIGVAAVTLANGADNVAVYVPLFAAAGAQDLAVILIVFALGIAALLATCRWLGRRPLTLRAVERHGRTVVPLVFIALGLAIMGEAFL